MLSSAGLALAASAPTPSHWFVHIHYTSQVELEQLSRRFGHLIVDQKNHDVSVDVDESSLDDLIAEGRAVTLDLEASQRLQSVAGHRIDSIPDFACYRTVEETYASMDSLVTQHPTLASVVNIGNSWERTQNAANGYPLRVLKLSNSAVPGPKPKMFAMFAIHAREYTTAELGMRLAEWLVGNYGKDPQATWLLDHNEFHFLIQANPDGRKQAEAGILWRKNTDDSNGTCGVPTQTNQPGIDLNRNYPFNWNTPFESGSSNNVCDEIYRGPTAASEPETQAVLNYVAGTPSMGVYSGGIFPDRRVDDRDTPVADDVQGLFLDIHSYSRLVLWPWGDTPTPAPNMATLRTLGRRIAWYNGYSAISSEDLYPSDGTTIDTIYGYLGVPSYTIELGVDFFETCDSFTYSTFPANLAAILYSARTLHAPLQLPSGPDVTQLSVPTDLITPGDSILVRARLDDTRFGGSEASQAISGASATIDTLPWEAGIPTQLLATDGTFSSAVEDAFATLPSTGLANGLHLIYVQGADASAAKGPPLAAFVEVAPANTLGQVSGFVYDALQGVPLAASIRVTGTNDTHATTSSANDGAYARSAHAGQVTIEASSPGFLTEHSGVNLTGGGAVSHDFSLFPLCPRFVDTAESGGGGWNAQPPWGIVNNVAGNPTRVWTDSPAGNYANSVDTRLTSPQFNFSGQNEVTVEFDDKCATEPDYDFGRLEVSVDAANTEWTEVYRCSGRPTWAHQLIALPQATNAAGARIRFRFTSDNATTFEGWSLDNIRVSAGGLACRVTYGDVLFQSDFEILK
jgi:murein tripeptide amidase MpaA